MMDEDGFKVLNEPDNLDRLFKAWREGHRDAYDRLTVLLHDDLKKIASGLLRYERDDHSLQTLDLVDKLYLKLLGSKTIPWTDHVHFLRSVARTMKQILIDHARGWARRAGGRGRVALDRLTSNILGVEQRADGESLEKWLALDQALAALEVVDPDGVCIAELKLFLGFTLEEIAGKLSLPINKVKRDWLSVKSYLGYRV